MNHAQKILSMILIANWQTPKIMQPGKESFNFPAALVAPEFASILSLWLLPVNFVRRYHLKVLMILESLIKRVAIIVVTEKVYL